MHENKTMKPFKIILSSEERDEGELWWEFT
jgi:hypothetical protein